MVRWPNSWKGKRKPHHQFYTKEQIYATIWRVENDLYDLAHDQRSNTFVKTQLLVSVVLVLSFCQGIVTYLCISKYKNDIYGISLAK